MTAPMPDLDKAAGVLAKTGVVSAYQGRTCIQALSDAGLLLPEGFVALPRDLVTFLLGESAYKGIWFSDTLDPSVPSPPRYWWRKDLAAYRAMIQAQGERE